MRERERKRNNGSRGMVGLYSSIVTLHNKGGISS
jgi:hypothetical protein